MDTKNLACYDRGYWEAIEGIYECLPDLNVAAAFALIIETVHCQLARLPP